MEPTWKWAAVSSPSDHPGPDDYYLIYVGGNYWDQYSVLQASRDYLQWRDFPNKVLWQRNLKLIEFGVESYEQYRSLSTTHPDLQNAKLIPPK